MEDYGLFHEHVKVVMACVLLFGLCVSDAWGDDYAVTEPLWSYEAEGSVSVVEISSDGGYLAFQTDDNVYFFDNQGRKLWSNGLDHTACEVAISSDGGYVAAGACTQYGNEVALFDRQGNRLWGYDTSGWVGDLAISSDGTYIASIGLTSLYLFERQGTKLWEFGTGSGSSVDISADGSLIVADGSDREFGLFDKEGNELWSYKAEGDIYSLAISKDGSYVAAGSIDDNLYLFDQRGDKLWSYQADDCVNTVAISSDGSYIAAGSWDDQVYLFDAQGNKLWSYETGDAVSSVAISSDGGWIAAASSDNVVYLFDQEGRKIWSYETGGSVEDVTISSDGRYIAAATHYPDSKVYFLARDSSSETSPPTSEVATTKSAEITDDFAEVVGEFPSLLNDHDDTTYVRGGLKAGDWDASFKMGVVETDPLKFKARVKCLEGGCGGKTVCGFQFFAKNQASGGEDRLEGAKWEETGIHEYELTLEDPEKCIDNGEVEFHFSFQCNMDGRILEFYQLGAEPAPEAEPGSTVTVYLGNLDDDDLYVNLYMDKEDLGALELPSGSESMLFGEIETSPGTHRFEISWEDPDTGDRYLLETDEDLSSGEETELTLSTEEHRPLSGTVEVYVDNQDDDDLEIGLWVDDQFKGSEEVSAGSSRLSFGEYDLSPADHDFKIRWTDPDTDESYETVTTQLIGTEKSTEVTLTAKRLETSTAVVNVKNADDDEIFVMLYIDDELRNTTSLAHWTQHVESFTLPSGTHTFRIEWGDSDTDEDYNVSVTQNFDPGETRKVNLELEEHLATAARVYVESEYYQEIPVMLLIMPEGTVAQETVPPGHSDLGEHMLDPGEHAFNLIWTDPPSGNEYESQYNETLGSGQITTVKLKLVRPLEVELYPQSLDIYEGETAHVFLDLWNKGSSPSRNVVATVEMDDSSILEVEPTYRIGDVKPKDGGSWPIYLKGLEEGNGQLRIAVKGDDLLEVVEYVSVKVTEPPKATRLVADQGAVKVETFEETAEQREDDLKSSLLREVDQTQFTSTVLGDGIEVKLDVYGNEGGSYVDVEEPVYVKFYVKNTGKMGMWVRVVPLEPNLDYEWKGDAVARVPDNKFYYQVKTGLAGTRSVEGLAYVVSGEALELTLKCIPKEDGRLVLGGTVYHTNSLAMNQLALTDENGREFLIHYNSFENKYGHEDESFFAQDLKDFDEHFGIISVPPWEITFPRWVNLETLREEMVQKEIEVKMKKTFGQRASAAVTSIFSWGGW